MNVYILDISTAGEVTYMQLDTIDYSQASNTDRLDELGMEGDEKNFPTLDHINVIKEEIEYADGEVGLISDLWVWASAPSIVAFAGLIKAYLLRNKKREVSLYWKNGKTRLIVKGDLSVDEITRLLQENDMNN